jgi:hypothetical protein
MQGLGDFSVCIVVHSTSLYDTTTLKVQELGEFG